MRFSFTARALFYLLVLVLSAVPALFAATPAGYVPALTLLFCLLLSLGQMVHTARKVRFEAASGTVSCRRGESVDFAARAENSAAFLPALVRAELCMTGINTPENRTTNLELALSPGQSRAFGFDVDFSHIGFYTAGIRRFTVRDLLGVAAMTREADCVFRVEILPKTWPIGGLAFSTERQVETSRALTASQVSGTDYTGVREYAFGDPMKSIHWKLSAHAGGFMTKQTESYTGTGLTVILDLEIPEPSTERRLDLYDALTEAAASLGNAAVRDGLECEILYFAVDRQKRRVPYTAFDDFRAFLGESGILSPAEETDAAALLRECNGLYGQNNVALCTSLLTEEKIQALISLRRGRKNPMVFFFLPGDVYDSARDSLLRPLKRLEQAGIPCTVAVNASDLTV